MIIFWIIIGIIAGLIALSLGIIIIGVWKIDRMYKELEELKDLDDGEIINYEEKKKTNH